MSRSGHRPRRPPPGRGVSEWSPAWDDYDRGPSPGGGMPNGSRSPWTTRTGTPRAVQFGQPRLLGPAGRVQREGERDHAGRAGRPARCGRRRGRRWSGRREPAAGRQRRAGGAARRRRRARRRPGGPARRRRAAARDAVGLGDRATAMPGVQRRVADRAEVRRVDAPPAPWVRTSSAPTASVARPVDVGRRAGDLQGVGSSSLGSSEQPLRRPGSRLGLGQQLGAVVVDLVHARRDRPQFEVFARRLVPGRSRSAGSVHGGVEPAPPSAARGSTSGIRSWICGQRARATAR